MYTSVATSCPASALLPGAIDRDEREQYSRISVRLQMRLCSFRQSSQDCAADRANQNTARLAQRRTFALVAVFS